MSIFDAILLSYGFDVLAIGGLLYAYGRADLQRFLISDDPHRSTGERELYARLVLNMVVSGTFILGVAYVFGDRLVHTRSMPWWRYGLEPLTTVMLYDFAYYFFHRYPLHEWKVLRSVHAVHHAARNPRVLDSLLLHPVETLLGLSLLFLSLAAVGGVHLFTFAVLFNAYTVFNLLNHSGISIPHFPLKTLGVLAAKHDRHHHSMLSGNYASITPLPDILFGTAE